MNDEQLELPGIEEPKPLLKGFADPEVRKRAMARSLATRQLKKSPNVALDWTPEDLALLKRDGVFCPTTRMLRILEVALSLEGGDTIRSWFAHVGMDRNVWYQWKKIEGFESWWKEAFLKGIKQYESQWVLIGLKKMNKDFRYWNEVGKKLYGYIEKVAVKEEKSPEEEALYRELLDLFVSEKKVHAAKEIHFQEDAINVEVLETSLLEDLKESEK